MSLELSFNFRVLILADDCLLCDNSKLSMSILKNKVFFKYCVKICLFDLVKVENYKKLLYS